MRRDILAVVRALAPRVRYHSPSSLELAGSGAWGPGEGCRRAWALRYLAGLRKPAMTWDEVEDAIARRERLPPGVRSAALGTRVHLYGERYLTGVGADTIDWNSLPGQVLQSMLPHLPAAGSLRSDECEVPWTMAVAGVLFRGVSDIAPRGRPQIGDLKTTREIAKWAKLPHGVAERIDQPKRSLRDDLQAALYALWSAARAGGRRETELRWTYGETDRVRRCLPVVQVMPTAHARAVVGKWLPRAREVATYRTVEDAPANTGACFDYGGCWYRYAGHCREPLDVGRWALHIERTEHEENIEEGRQGEDVRGAARRGGGRGEGRKEGEEGQGGRRGRRDRRVG